MADQAVATGTRIGVIATLPTTLNPTTDLVRRRGDYKYVSPIPPEITRPAAIPAHLIKDGGDEILSEVNSET